MEPSETIRHLAPGQYWAMLNPLSLTRVEAVHGDGDGGSLVQYQLRQWTPAREDADVIYLAPLASDNFRFLWYKTFTSRTTLLTDSEIVRFYAGDVLLYRDPTRAENGERLFFVGPETTNDTVQVLADWEIYFSQSMFVRLFQPGPGRKDPPPKSVYEHMRKPAV